MKSSNIESKQTSKTLFCDHQSLISRTLSPTETGSVRQDRQTVVNELWKVWEPSRGQSAKSRSRVFLAEYPLYGPVHVLDYYDGGGIGGVLNGKSLGVCAVKGQCTVGKKNEKKWVVNANTHAQTITHFKSACAILGSKGLKKTWTTDSSFWGSWSRKPDVCVCVWYRNKAFIVLRSRDGNGLAILLRQERCTERRVCVAQSK